MRAWLKRTIDIGCEAEMRTESAEVCSPAYLARFRRGFGHGLVDGLLYAHPRPCRLHVRRLGPEAHAYVLGFQAARAQFLECADDLDSV